MAWDFTTHPEVIRNRLRFASPENVYAALEEYGTHWQRFRFALGDPELERLLFEREDRLIDLGLARYGRSDDGVVARIYKRARDGSGDADYDRAIQLACLSNPVIVAVIDSRLLKDPTAEDGGELHRLAMEGDNVALGTLMRNPGARALLATVYSRSGVMKDIPEERWLKLVQCSIGNPALNRDDSNNDGPDHIAYRVREALRDLVASAPTTPDWVQALYQLLIELDPAKRWLFENEKAVLDALDRWKGIVVESPFDSAKDETGEYTGLPLADEFRCLIAALYGKVLVDKKLVPVGKPDSDDVALRCAYYGNAKMTPEEVAAAREKDGATLAFAALCNPDLTLSVQTRAEVEEIVSWDLERLREKRYAELKARYPRFDARPAYQVLRPDESEKSAASPEIQTLAALVTEQGSILRGLARTVLWGFIILGALVLWRR
ncbi:hypothetical protein [Paraburkholderia youngii]|uniref:hypothetical protein n=1 Tax=Paraburkholderia youngii TaxID=2782701 RepID=UPI003D1C50B3